MTAIAERFKPRLGRMLAVLTVTLLALCAQVAQSAAQGISIIRDAEIESMIRDFSLPLFKVAGLPVKPRVYLVADRSFNAFVIEDGSVFVNYGTLIEVKDSLELKAILAHEIGHVAGGHLAGSASSRTAMRCYRPPPWCSAPAPQWPPAPPEAPRSVGSPPPSSSPRNLRPEFADGLPALGGERRRLGFAQIPTGDRQSGRGMVEVLKYLKAEESAGYSPYVRTHPDAATRINQVEAKAKALSNWNKKSNPADDARLALARAKVVGFLEPRQTVINSYPNSDKSLAARYARVLTAYKSGAGISAIPVMANIAASAPSNPFLEELLGQMYYETGQPQKALRPLAHAVSMAPKEPLIRVLYGQALLDAGGKSNINEAILQLKRAANVDTDAIIANTTLARAYAAIGQMGEAISPPPKRRFSAATRVWRSGLPARLKKFEQGQPRMVARR